MMIAPAMGRGGERGCLLSVGLDNGKERLGFKIGDERAG